MFLFEVLAVMLAILIVAPFFVFILFRPLLFVLLIYYSLLFIREFIKKYKLTGSVAESLPASKSLLKWITSICIFGLAAILVENFEPATRFSRDIIFLSIWLSVAGICVWRTVKKPYCSNLKQKNNFHATTGYVNFNNWMDQHYTSHANNENVFIRPMQDFDDIPCDPIHDMFSSEKIFTHPASPYFFMGSGIKGSDIIGSDIMGSGTKGSGSDFD